MVTYNVRTVSPKVVSSLGNICTIDGQPHTRKNILIKDIKLRTKHQNLCNRRDFLRMCLVKNISTLEITNLAMKTVSESNAKQRQYKEKKRFIKLRIYE